MKILGFAASNSRKSINKKLVEYTISCFRDEETQVLDLNDFEMPIYSFDREKDTGIPQLAEDFAAKIMESELIVISFAEHNGAYSAAFKSVFDWVSRIKDKDVWKDKKLFLMATSPGGRGGQSVLKIAEDRMPRHGAIVLDTFSLPSFLNPLMKEKGLLLKSLESGMKRRLRN